MKKAVVYYSLDGSTRQAAAVIAERIGADVFELEETRKRSGKPLSFMVAAFAALTGAKSRLKSIPSMDGYDTIYVGSPIWASNLAPAVNTFLSKLDAAGKEIVMFTVQADANLSEIKGVDKQIERLRQKGADVHKVIRLHGAPPKQTADKTHMSGQLDALL